MNVNKTRKTLFIILLIVIISIIGIFCYLVYKDSQQQKLDDSNKEYDTTITQEIKDIYNKYINYSEFNTMHYNENIDANSSNGYLISNAIYSLLKKNNESIPNVSCDVEEKGSGENWDISIDEPFKMYTEEEILDEIKELFGVSKSNSIFENIPAYLIDAKIQYRNNKIEVYNCINKTNLSYYIFSEIESVKKNDKELIIYDRYIQLEESVGFDFYNTTCCSEKIYSCYTDEEDLNNEEYDFDEKCDDRVINIKENNDEKVFDYILNEKEDLIGKYEHIFKKANDGKFYWISTKKIK